MAFAGAFPDSRKDRDAFVFLDHGVDQFHDEHRLADASAAEHGGFAALSERREKIDHLNAGLDHRARRGLVFERGWWIVDAASRGISRERRSAIPNRSNHVEETPQNGIS